MTTLREAAQQALEAMDKATRFMSNSDYKKLNEAIDALRAALAEPEHKPMHPEMRKMWEEHFDKCFRAMPFDPPQRKPPPVVNRALTDNEIFAVENDIPDHVVSDREWTLWFARAVIAEFCKINEMMEQANSPMPLSDEELGKIINENWGVGVWAMARAIERAHGIGGQDE